MCEIGKPLEIIDADRWLSPRPCAGKGNRQRAARDREVPGLGDDR